MQIVLEEKDLPHVKARKRNRIAVVSIATTAVVILATLIMTLVFVPTNRVALAADASKSGIGPLDELGQRIVTVSALPHHMDDHTVVVYNKDALVIKRKAQEKAATLNVVQVDNPSDPNAQFEHQSSFEGSSGIDQASLDERSRIDNAAREAEEKKQRDIAEAQRRADDELRAQQVAAQQAAVEAEVAAKRLAAQRAQEAEAARKAQEEANYQYSLTHPTDKQFYSALAISGEVVPYVINKDDCPDSTAGAWRWGGDMKTTQPLVDDDKGTYFVGHNPGVFHMLIDNNVGLGDTISVWDSKGHARVYTIDDVFIIDAGTLFDKKLQKRTIFSGGESITLQTCIEDGRRYKVFVAH